MKYDYITFTAVLHETRHALCSCVRMAWNFKLHIVQVYERVEVGLTKN